MLFNCIFDHKIFPQTRVNDLFASLVISICSSSLHHFFKSLLNQKSSSFSCFCFFDYVVSFIKNVMYCFRLISKMNQLNPKSNKNSFTKLYFCLLNDLCLVLFCDCLFVSHEYFSFQKIFFFLLFS